MKTVKILGTTLVAVSAIIALVTPVHAQELSATTEPETPATANTNTEQSQRIEKRKAELKTKLTNAQQTRLQTRCKNAQGKLQSVTQRTTAVQQNREKIYTKLLDNITSLQPKLVAAEIDTVQLDAGITELKAAIEVFKASSVTYEQAIKDTAELDCQADPVAFQASLSASRTALQKLRTDAGSIRTITNQKIKPALVVVKTSLTETKAE